MMVHPCLVINKLELLGHRGFHKLVFKYEVLSGEDRVVVFFNIGQAALFFGNFELDEHIPQRTQQLLDAFDVMLLVLG